MSKIDGVLWQQAAETVRARHQQLDEELRAHARGHGFEFQGAYRSAVGVQEEIQMQYQKLQHRKRAKARP